ncbi:MAG: dUTP diphosphatase [Acidimicrobiia bacterium]
MQVTFKRLDPELPVPTPANIGDAAIDLHTRIELLIPPGGRVKSPTGLAVAIPAGWAGLVLPRSGHADRLGVGLVNSPGLIDSGYRGEIAVILINHGSEQARFFRGDRIAQLAIVPVPAIEWVEVDALEESARGVDGFGSTGT